MLLIMSEQMMNSFQEQKDDDPVLLVVMGIVEHARDGAREYQDRFPKADRILMLSYGSKRLIVAFDSDHAEANTLVETISTSTQKLQNETTLLYRAGRELMERMAEELRKPVTYRLMTKNEKMRLWADSIGEEVFGWEYTDTMPEPDGKPLKIFQTTISPD